MIVPVKIAAANVFTCGPFMTIYLMDDPLDKWFRGYPRWVIRQLVNQGTWGGFVYWMMAQQDFDDWGRLNSQAPWCCT